MKTFLSLFMALALGVQACNSDSDDKKDNLESVFGKTYLITDSTALNRSENRLSGTGSLVFNDPLGEEERNFKLSFRLEDGGSLTLTAYADQALAQGVGVLLKRQGSALSVMFKGPEGESATQTLAGVNASDSISLRIDVHNSEEPAHILVWPEGISTYNEEAAVMNSEAALEVPGQGQGKLWGLSLQEATVEGLEVDEALFSDSE